MGWCSGTEIFDIVAKEILEPSNDNRRKAMLGALIDALEDADWDCQRDSRYYMHPVVQEIMKEKHPDWFEEETEGIE